MATCLRPHTIKAITVHQPYAWFISDGTKTIEVRSRRTNYRGDIVIHAGAKRNAAWSELDFGCLYCVVELVDCRPLTRADCEAAMMHEDDFREGLWAWVLNNPRDIGLIDYKGQHGMFNVDNDLIKYF